MSAPETLTAPERYTAHGRETIDRIRDFAGACGDVLADEIDRAGLARRLGDVLADEIDRAGLARRLGDALFMFFCQANALKYEDRAGLKGPREDDDAKAAFYRAMVRHVGLGEPDPRSTRPDFEPYVRERWTGPRSPKAHPPLVDLLVSCYSRRELTRLAQDLQVVMDPLLVTAADFAADFAEALTLRVHMKVLQAVLCQDRPRRVNEINAVFATLAKEGADGSE